ncbi:MAG TPA: amidohydrolase family protein [Cytophagaceae bacterium]|jgi:imidazolonepropionase-like amidohydrolase
MKNIFLTFFLNCFLFNGFAQSQYDLIIKNATIFNSITGKTETNKDILIRDGKIIDVVPRGQLHKSKNIIEAKEKLVTPGFIDVHIHPTDILGDFDKAPLNVETDSIPLFRKRISQTFLPYGVTTIRSAGQPEQWLPMMVSWQKNSRPEHVDIYNSGGALVTLDPKRKTNIAHAAVKDSADAARKVQEYYDQGIRHLKLYWRLQYSELASALHKAEQLKMNVFAHVGDNSITSVDSVITLGVKNIEHAYTLITCDLSDTDNQIIGQKFEKRYKDSPFQPAFIEWVMEQLLFVGREKPGFYNLISKLKNNNVSVTPTLHIFAQRYGLTWFYKEMTEMADLPFKGNEFQTQECIKGYEVLASYVKILYDSGVQLNLGTDCPEGGKAALSEMILLNELGIPMQEVLKIATINSAKAMDRENLYGSIEKGKKANLIIFGKSPLEDRKNLTGKKTIIKEGVVFK